ncbi:MAG: OFA family MFS transporter [Lachnospiraceae bacterium]|jgi:OFA family oxalate/formate antiporter-like MFS transporter|nr:OFA family MFS transporter [Lachnospiraceae bacterium]
MEKIPPRKKRYLYLANSFLLLLLSGVAYTWSIFVGPLEEWFGWSRAQTSLAFTLNVLCFSVGALLCGFLSVRYHYERIAQLAALLLAAGFFLSTRVTAVWQLYFTYSFLCGTGVGLMYSSIIATIPVWFRDKAGLATGLLVMGYALSTTILGPVCQQLLSTRGWQMTFLLLGMADLIVMGFGGFLVRLPRAVELSGLPEMPEFSNRSANEVTTAEMIHSASFYSFFLYIVAIGSCGLTMINHMSPFLTGDIGMSAVAAAAAVSIGALINGAGRVAVGIIFDRFGSVRTARFLAAMNLTFVLALSFAYRAGNPYFVVCCIGAILFAFGGNAATIPSITRGLYGEMHFARNYSVVNLSALFSGIPASLVGMLQARSGSYGGMFVLVGGCALCALIASLGMNSKKRL